MHRGSNMLNKDFGLSSSLRLLILSISISVALVISGCATAQKVNLEALNAAKAKPFELGVIKSAGSFSAIGVGWPSHIKEKEKALARIPIEEICATLKEQYSLQIDTNLDRTPKVVLERIGNGIAPPPSTRAGLSLSLNMHPITENAYYGNLEYDDTSALWLMFVGNSKTKNDQDVPDVVNVTYGLEVASLGFKVRFLYAINVKSSGKDVLSLKGIVETISMPRKGVLYDEDSVWNEYVHYASNINDALKRDLVGASK